MEGIFMALGLIGGLVLFLYGMDMMGDGLKKLAGGKLESVLAKLTSTRWRGFLLGLAVTAVIQSSSATTVMLVGFVNSGIMALGQTISIIMGANIGTTVTSWLLSTAAIGETGGMVLKLLKPDSFTPILALIGFLMISASKSDTKKNTGVIFIGFAILMFGMDAMSGAVESLRDNETFTQMLTMFSNPVIGILIGTLFTAIIQSSSASVGVLQALALTCVIPYETAIPVILGMNIGTTITPIISSISGNTDSKRVAFSCLYIKMVGVIVVAGLFYLINAFAPFAFLTERAGAMNIAIVHTLFNIFSTIILIPFCSWFEKLAIRTIPNNNKERENDVFDTLDERFLTMPGFAVEKARDLVCEMAQISRDAFTKATALFAEYDQAQFDEVAALEKSIDKYEDKISTYLVKVAEQDMSAKDSKTVTELLHFIGDFERISDHALNIAEAAHEIYSKGISFSEQAKADLAIISNAVAEILELTISLIVEENLEAAKNIEPLEQVIDRLKRKIKNGHIDRLRQGDCTMELGFVLSDLLNNYERISDHCSNIAVCFIEVSHDSFEAHKYIKQLKTDEGSDFAEVYEQYKQKYYID